MREPKFCIICENKGADQLRSNCEVDQRFCFRYTGSTIPTHSKSKISSHKPSSVAAQPVRKPPCCFSRDAARILYCIITRLYRYLSTEDVGYIILDFNVYFNPKTPGVFFVWH